MHISCCDKLIVNTSGWTNHQSQQYFPLWHWINNMKAKHQLLTVKRSSKKKKEGRKDKDEKLTTTILLYTHLSSVLIQAGHGREVLPGDWRSILGADKGVGVGRVAHNEHPHALLGMLVESLALQGGEGFGMSKFHLSHGAKLAMKAGNDWVIKSISGYGTKLNLAEVNINLNNTSCYCLCTDLKSKWVIVSNYVRKLTSCPCKCACLMAIHNGEVAGKQTAGKTTLLIK